MVDQPEARDDEDLILTLDPEETSPPEGEKPPVVPGPSAAPPPDVGLADLEKQIERERAENARRTEENRRLQQERDNALAMAQEAERRGVTTYELYAEGQIKAGNDKMEALVQQQESAYGEGDFKRVAELNRQIGVLGGQLAVFEREKLAYAQQRERMKQQPQRPQQPAQPQPGQVDSIDRPGRFSEETKSFLRKHPELMRGDGTLKRSALDAHEKALDAGFRADTPEYFQHIEGTLANTRPPPELPSPAARSVPTASYSAPVARGSAPGSADLDGRNFRMTPKMQKLAAEQGVEPKEWAREYVRLLKEGRIQPIT